jgi:predicted ABC-type exoprotein transport system permease subunit
LPLLLAAATDHIGVFLVALLLGFGIGVYGHIVRQRWLVLTGILVIALISLYFVAAGEVQTFPS